MLLLAPQLPRLRYIQLLQSFVEAPQAPTPHIAQLLRLDIRPQAPGTRVARSQELWIIRHTCPITDHRRPPLAIARQIPLGLSLVLNTDRCKRMRWEAIPDSTVRLTSL